MDYLLALRLPGRWGRIDSKIFTIITPFFLFFLLFCVFSGFFTSLCFLFSLICIFLSFFIRLNIIFSLFYSLLFFPFGFSTSFSDFVFFTFISPLPHSICHLYCVSFFVVFSSERPLRYHSSRKTVPCLNDPFVLVGHVGNPAPLVFTSFCSSICCLLYSGVGAVIAGPSGRVV